MLICNSLKETQNFLESIGNNSENSKIEAEHILMNVLNMCKSELYINYDRSLSNKEVSSIQEIIEQRAKGCPLSYIINEHFFYETNFYVNQDVLIPRSETEGVIDKLLELGDEIFFQKKEIMFIDAGSGSGCVGLSVAKKRPKWSVILIDKYITAINIMKKNLHSLGLSNVNITCNDWLNGISDSSVDFIFSNPPYVSYQDNLEKSVCDFEPHHALFSDNKGLGDILKIIKQAKMKLADSGLLFIENGYGQSQSILDQLRINDFTDITTYLDYNGTKRFASSRKNNL